MFGAFREAYCECEPNANFFVQKWFSDCIYTPWEWAAFLIGMSSIMFWLVAQMPQFISNLQHQSAEALSPWLLLQWLAGDAFNLLGCLLTGDQLATQTFTAIYFIFADCAMISQYIYYGSRAGKKQDSQEDEQGLRSLIHKQITDFPDHSEKAFLEFQKTLANITVVVSDLGEDLESKHDAQQDAHQYRPITFVAGRSGASMIAHATHSPRATPHCSESEQSIATALPRNVDTKRPGVEEQGAGRARKDLILSLEQSRSSAARLGKLPEIHAEKLFPSAKAMRRHLRRLENQYGLECGPPSASRLTIHHGKSLEERQEIQSRRPSKEIYRLGRNRLPEQILKGAACVASLVAVGTSGDYLQMPGNSVAARGLAVVSRKILLEASGPGTPSSVVRIGRKVLLICGEGRRPWWLKSFGDFLGWGSSIFYFGSRFSQIVMNYQRMSAEGLSLTMLRCAILANTCMSVSIFMRAGSLQELANKSPWIMGSMGTVSLDLFLLFQANYLNSRSAKLERAVPDEHTPLLA